MNVGVMLGFTQAILVMTLLGFLIIELLLPPKTISRSLVLALAPVVGAGLCSCIQFLFRRPMFTVERGLLLVLFGFWVWKRRPVSSNFARLLEYRIPILDALLYGAMLLVLAASVVRIEHIPHGGTDGWAIWNSHARYLYRDPNGWQQHIQNTFHPDYPLLLPALVTRVWRYAGVDVSDLGGFVGLLFLFVAIAVLGTALAELRGSSAGILLAFTLLTTSQYVVLGSHQEADIPLSTFVLSTIALIYLYFEQETPPKNLLLLAGFLAGSAAWTKNEGILFLVAASITLAFPTLWKPRATLPRVALFLLGALLPVAILLYFKTAIASTTDLFQNRQLSELSAKVMDWDRHATTFGSFVSMARDFGRWTIHPIVPLFAFFILRGFDRREIGTFRWRTAAGILLIVLSGYYCIYVITPVDLQVHLDSSLARLLMHLWPSALLLIGVIAKGEQSLRRTTNDHRPTTTDKFPPFWS
jgi:hypothetical protein